MIILMLVLTTLLWGTVPIIEKIGIGKTDPFTAVAIRSFTITTVMMITLSTRGKWGEFVHTEPKVFIAFMISGVMAGLLGMWTYLSALKLGATSKIVPIAAAYPLITALLSVAILGEKVTLLRVIGTLLIVGGIWLVK